MSCQTIDSKEIYAKCWCVLEENIYKSYKGEKTCHLENNTFLVYVALTQNLRDWSLIKLLSRIECMNPFSQIIFQASNKF